MKVRYYYFRDKKNRPIITVCLFKKEENPLVHRGVSICSLKDDPYKVEGRQIAYERALRACFDQMSTEMVNIRLDSPEIAALDTVKKTMTAFWFPYKSTFNAILTDFERRILSGGEATQ